MPSYIEIDAEAIAKSAKYAPWPARTGRNRSQLSPSWAIQVGLAVPDCSGGCAPPLMSAEHQGLERKHQRLQPQNQCMHEPKGIDGVKDEPLERAGVF